MSKHYRTNKKEYYINLNSVDATIVQKGSGANSNYVYEWNNIQLNQNLSRDAKIGIVKMCSNLTTSTSPFIIRCKQVKNEQYESGGNFGPIIYLENGLKNPTFLNMYPISVQNLDIITLSFNTNYALKDFGIQNNVSFNIQLNVIDYDTEEVRTELMPTYIKDSTAIHYKI